MNQFKNTICLVLLAASFGCSSGGAAVDIGASRSGEKLADYADHWVGYAEAYKFADGSDNVRIVLDAQGNGTLEIGNSPALTPATDADVAYPPNIFAGFEPPQSGDPEGRITDLFPGVSYPIKMAAIQNARIQLLVNPWQVEQDWCALQTPYYAGGDYRCVPNLGFLIPEPGTCELIDDDGTQHPIDCGKLSLCRGNTCTCTAAGCSTFELPGGSTAYYTQLDAALADSGNSLVGTLLVGKELVQQRVNVRLVRQ